MRLALDSSTLISLAWSGSLQALALLEISLVVPDVVIRETVSDGVRRGHADAVAISAMVVGIEVAATNPDLMADAAVLEVAKVAGALATNDVALGRRASSLGVTWLRTADLIIGLVRSRRLAREEGASMLDALLRTGRIAEELYDEYLKEL